MLFITFKFFDQNKLIVNWQCESLADTLVYINAKENRLTPIRETTTKCLIWKR